MPTGDVVLTGEYLRAKEITLADPTIASILSRTTYYIPGATNVPLREELNIVALTIVLEQPMMIDADLPTMDLGYRGGGDSGGTSTQIDYPPPYYIDGVTHITMIDARSLYVNVDVSREKVVQVIAAPF